MTNKTQLPRTDEIYLKWAKEFCIVQPTIYDSYGTWWIYEYSIKQFIEVDEIELLNMLRLSQQLGDRAVREKRYILDALKLIAREQETRTPTLPKHKIQFMDQILDIKTRIIEPIEDDNGFPRYMTTNCIPHTIGEKNHTPTMDKLFQQWVGSERVQTLYEVIAYCCYRDMPIQIITVLFGSQGRNGKSQFLKVVERFVGAKNRATTSLDRLTDRPFETYKLYRKLVAIMGETDFGRLSRSEIIKRLSGGDSIDYERKGKDGFTDYSYATLLIASNSLPSTADNTDAFYRRWMIIDFPNTFPEGKPIIDTIPEEEYRSLARKVTELLPQLLERGQFTGQGTIEERKERYIEASNPLELFIREHCEQGEEETHFLKYGTLWVAYRQYLKQRKRLTVKRKEFKEMLEDMGFEIEKATKTDQRTGEEYNGQILVFGLWFKDPKGPFHGKMEKKETSSLHPLYRGRREKLSISSIFPFPAPKDLLNAISRNGGRASVDELINCFPGTPLQQMIEALCQSGAIHPIKPGVYGLVEDAIIEDGNQKEVLD